MASRVHQLREDDDDKLSDIVMTGSTDISRQPSLQPSGPSMQVSAAPSVVEEVDELADDADGMDVDVKNEETAEAGPSEVKPTAQETKAMQRELKKQRKDEQEENLAKGRSGLKNRKLADSIKRFEYLLGQTDLFQHFCDLKAKRDPVFAQMLKDTKTSMDAKKGKKRGKKGKEDGGARRRKTEKEEDAELMNDDEGEDQPFVFDESPAYVKGGEMRDYQVQGLNWMISLHHNGISGILADEMGLGKTISFLGYLKNYLDTPGPHLVVVPKSTLDNWSREFEHWVPGFRTIILRGTPEERQDMLSSTILKQKFDVCITSYEICQREKNALKKLAWEYIVIDEAHRIKNVDSILSQIVRIFESRGRLLITGTPLQNNLNELWALLNFLLPDVFSSIADFDSWFTKQHAEVAAGDNADASIEDVKMDTEQTDELETADEPIIEEEPAEPVASTSAEPIASTSAAPAAPADPEKENAVVKQLHKVLRPFLLRRVKADVEHSLLPKKEINIYVGMTDMQRKWYRMLLERDLDAVNGANGRKEGKTRLLNIVMQLRKCCNHPYLFDGAEPGPPYTTDEHLVFNSGKMLILDKLLKAYQAKGSRVLIFSQMSRMLDILEDYCLFRGYGYCRIDGSTAHEDRIAAIDDYNREGSEKFVFLLTTRAGGLGINLTSADVVVLYDSDWNPQADLQAMDRAHRIGQKKQVYVFRFVTENAVEEKVLERAASKLQLDRLVIQEGRQKSSSKNADKGELIAMVQHGADKITDANTSMLVDDDIDAVIARGEEKTSSLQSKWQGMGIDELTNFKVESATTAWEGEAFGRKKLGMGFLEPSKRDRKGGNYSVDGYYRDAMGERRGTGPRAPRKPANLDFQFMPKEFYDLLEKERRWHQKEDEVIVMIPEGKEAEGKTPEELEAKRAAEQELIDNAEALTEAEELRKKELSTTGFHDWTRRELGAFIKGAENHGRKNWSAIAKEIGDSKTIEQVKEYGKVFWARYAEIEDGEKMVARVENAESKKDSNRRTNVLIKKHVADCAYPYQQLTIPYGGQTKGKQYTEEEDRFLLVQLSRVEYGSDDIYEGIKRAICEWPAFRFDWFIKSRTPAEIGRRCTTLVGLLVKDAGEPDLKVPTNTGKGPRKSAASTENGTASGTKSRKRKAAAATDDAEAGDAAGSRASTPVAGPSKSKKRR